MLLGRAPDAANDISSADLSAELEDSSLVDRALACELLCHVAHGADLPLPKRCVGKG